MTTVNDFFRPYGITPLSPLEVSNAVKERYYISQFTHDELRYTVKRLENLARKAIK